jgi:hypothetical protein
MWGAITSDLTDFVQTIKSDTSKVLNTEDGEGGSASDERMRTMQDLRRSFDTFSIPIEEDYSTEFARFMKSFTIEAHAAEIKTLLDEEIDISRYYVELVPVQTTPALFWGRFFFRVHLVESGGVLGLDEVEEEEGSWDAPEEQQQLQDSNSSSELAACKAKLAASAKECATLKGHVRVLTSRVKELEAAMAGLEVGSGCGGGGGGGGGGSSSGSEGAIAAAPAIAPSVNPAAPSVAADGGVIITPTNTKTKTNTDGGAEEEAECDDCNDNDNDNEELTTSQIMADLGDDEGEEEGW